MCGTFNNASSQYRKKLLSAIDNITLHAMQQEEYSTSASDSDDSSNSSSSEEEYGNFGMWIAVKAAFEQQRYVAQCIPVPKSHEFATILPMLSMMGASAKNIE